MGLFLWYISLWIPHYLFGKAEGSKRYREQPSPAYRNFHSHEICADVGCCLKKWQDNGMIFDYFSKNKH
jgi:hypothetical protein